MIIFCTFILILLRKNKQLPVDETQSSRILVVTGSCESTAQYMAFNNAFFAAQKQVSLDLYLKLNRL